MKALVYLITFFMGIFVLAVIPAIITHFGRLYEWEGFGTVPFSENYSVMVLIFMCTFIFIIVPICGLIFSIVSNHKP